MGCGEQMTVHEAIVIREITAAMTQISVITSWSPDERVCKNCKTVMAPVIGDIQLTWAAIGKDQSQSVTDEPRIIVPSFMPPREALQKAGVS
jgi:hypothetical protein